MRDLGILASLPESRRLRQIVDFAVQTHACRHWSALQPTYEAGMERSNLKIV